ncbi:MAG: SpoIIE family protein phosphatase [Sneathiellaceae bacterium]
MTLRPMTLKGRIAAFVLAILTLLGVGIYLVGSERLEIVSLDYAAKYQAHQESHWENTLNVLSLRLDDVADILLENAELRDAVRHQDDRAVAKVVQDKLAALQHFLPVSAIEVLSTGGTVLYSHGSGRQQFLTQGWPVTNVLRFGLPLHGLHRQPDGDFLLLFLLPIPTRDSALLTTPHAQAPSLARQTGYDVAGAIAFGLPLAQGINVLRHQLGQDVVVTAMGSRRPVSDMADVDLWTRLLAKLPVDTAGIEVVPDGGREFEVTSFPVHQVDGQIAAWLHSMRDVTVQSLRHDLLDWVTLTVSVGIGLLMVLLLYAYLGRAFEPLDEAVTVLDRLARGDTSLGLSVRRNDEVGRIAMAIEVFRARLLDLRRFDKVLRRQQRRQQAFIRREMETLAATLESGARDAVLADLSRIVGADADSADADADADAGGALSRELGLLAVAFRQMSERVRDQHVRLEQLVRELRDALEHKTRLIALEQELEIARNIQLSILPGDMAPARGFQIAADMLPAKEVGGDFYDFFAIDRDRIGVIVADVSGKGVPAAFFMLIARTLMRATALFGMSPGRCLARVNGLLAAENREMMFVTLFYGILDLRTGSLAYANAGHNPPLVCRSGGRVEVLPPTGGIAMAVEPGLHYDEARLDFAEGDVLLMFSDGVTEAFATDGSLFGDRRLAALLGSQAGDAKQVLQAILRDVQDFAAGAEQSDDITALVVRRAPGGPQEAS